MLTDREANICVELANIIPFAPTTISKEKLLKFCEHYHYSEQELEFALVDLARVRNLVEIGKEEYCFERVRYGR